MRLFLAALLAFTTINASAQFVNQSNNTQKSTSRTKSSYSADLNGWDRITVSFTPMKYQTDVKGQDGFNMTGFAIGYDKGFNIAPQLPIFLETGINMQYAFKSLDSEELAEVTGVLWGVTIGNAAHPVLFKATYSTLNLKIPVNLAYKLTFGDVSVIPYGGINFKVNIIGKMKFGIDDTDDLPDGWSEDDVWDEYKDQTDKTQSTNLLDKKEVEDNLGGDKDQVWNRFQMGWQIGVGVDYNSWHVGLGYTKDIMELCKKVKTSSVLISLGYNF